jgi:hypothetical protein
MKKMNPYDLQQRLTRVYWRLGSTSGGTKLSNAGYIEWFVKHIQCIPTTLKTCQ